MAREDLHFRLRIPEPLKERVEEAAKKNRRSMTAEIIERLDWSFDRATEEMVHLRERAEAAEARATESERLYRHYEEEVKRLRGEADRLRANQATDRATRATPEEPIFNFVLDAKGRPISWPEIVAHVYRTAKAAGLDAISIRTAAFNVEKQDPDKADAEYARLVRWYQQQTRELRGKDEEEH